MHENSGGKDPVVFFVDEGLEGDIKVFERLYLKVFYLFFQNYM
jgi:hypothetical protein